ncbi:hypothetical protein NIES25_44150 [Nostoc linckia NIES-25]|nr:hypothetical protein NIES25_44150 [Nostoc linckia NIES-25]
MEILFYAIRYLIIWALAWLIVELFKEIYKQIQSKPQNPPQQKPTPTTQTSVSPGEPSLESRLLTMLAGDRAACYRLVEATRRKYPGKPEVWYWEKTIQDLNHDRR